MDLPKIETTPHKTSSKWRTSMYVIWSLIGGIVLLLAFGISLGVLSVPVGIIVWTVVIVFCLRAPVNSLESHGVNRFMGTVVAYVLMFAVLIGIVLLASSPMFGISAQFSNLLESVPQYVQQANVFVNEFYSTHPEIFQNPTVQKYINDAFAAIGAWASTTAQTSAQGIVDIGGSVINSFMVIGFAMVVAFWVLMDLPAMGRECRRIVSPKYTADINFLHITFTRVLGGYIRGTLLQCALITLCCLIVFTVLGVPNAAAIAIITGVLNIIPVVGPWLGGALAAIAAIFAGPIIALAALIATILIQQVIYTFVSPKIMSSSVDVHPALVIIAMMAGSAIGGTMSGFVGSLAGMLISIPAVAVAKATFVYYFEKKTGRQVVATDGVFFKGMPSKGGLVDPAKDATAPMPPLVLKSKVSHKPAQHHAHTDKKDK